MEEQELYLLRIVLSTISSYKSDRLLPQHCAVIEGAALGSRPTFFTSSNSPLSTRILIDFPIKECNEYPTLDPVKMMDALSRGR